MMRRIYCAACLTEVSARLTSGAEIYPHRSDLADLPFWLCDSCGNYVGCHYKTKQRTEPLGCIPSPEIMRKRKEIHSIIDPIWQSGMWPRHDVYAALSCVLGRKYHTAELRNIAECDAVIDAARSLRARLG